MTGILYCPGENLSWRNPLTRSQRSTPAQREQAQKRFTTIRPALENGVKAVQVARTQNIPASTVRCWMKHYRDKGLAGLADAKTLSDKGKSRRFPADAITLVEGLALQTPQRSMAAIHRKARCHCSRKKTFRCKKEGQKIYYNEICILL
jgi:transposase-like protein